VTPNRSARAFTTPVSLPISWRSSTGSLPRWTSWWSADSRWGGNLALLAAGRYPTSLPPALAAIVAISPPLDLATCADALARPANRLYQTYFLRKLRRAYRSRQRRLPDLYARDRDRAYPSIRDYDAAITAPYGGYVGVADYYARSSAGPLLTAIRCRALILAAADDPLIPESSVSDWPLSDWVTREMTATGGHVGFVGRSSAPGFFWAAERALDFAREQVSF
jgi:predicted alpha/beta-fold hydrolase